MRVVFLFFLFSISLLASEKKLKMCITPNWAPFIFIDSDKKYSGIIMDYANIISTRSGYEFVPVVAKDYAKSRQMLYEGRCDIIMSAVKNKKNSEKYLITNPYVVFPRAYATHVDTSFIADFSFLLKKNRKVGIIKGAPAKVMLLKNYKDIEIVEFDTSYDALKALSNKNIIAFVNILPTLAYYIKMNGFNDIKIAGYFKKKIPISIFINRSHPELLPIFYKAIESITEEQKLKILDKWIHVEEGVSYEIFYRVLLLSILIIGVILSILYLNNYQNKKLNRLLKTRVDEEIAKNKEQQLLLFQQNRLAQMGEMVSMIAHQWRQPLNTISYIFSTMVMKQKLNKLDEQSLEKLQKDFNTQVKQISQTIDDFMNFFKSTKSEEIFLLNTILENSIKFSKPILEKNSIKVEFNQDRVIYSKGYPNELGQVFINIINNAKDALIENSISNKKIWIDLTTQNEMINIEFKDNAGGIAHNIIDKIFDPYFSTKDNKNGTGLGLYMSKMIVKKHKGNIFVRNIDSGAMFVITLPLLKDGDE